MEQRQLFNVGDMGQGDRRTKGQVRGKSRGHKHERLQKFSGGASPNKVLHMKKKCPPKEKNVAKKPLT